MTLFGLVISTRKKVRSRVKDLLIYERSDNPDSISGRYIDRATDKIIN